MVALLSDCAAQVGTALHAPRGPSIRKRGLCSPAKQLGRRECLLDAPVVFDHVTPFAGRSVPESCNDDTYKVTISARIDYRIAVMKRFLVLVGLDQRSSRSSPALIN